MTVADSAGDSTLSVVLADDHAIVRAGLRALLEHHDDIRVVAEATTADEAVRLCTAVLGTRVDVVLMDLRFGDGRGGVEATRQIRESPNAPSVLVLTNYDTDADILAAIEAGASGYLLKDTPPEELVSGVRGAAAGESALSPAVASRLLSRMRTPPDTVLTPREIEIIAEVATGRSNRQIARELMLSEMTVKSHLVHAFTKLGVGSRTAAVAEARRRGVID